MLNGIDLYDNPIKLTPLVEKALIDDEYLTSGSQHKPISNLI